jgi:hypothetical protein
MRAFDPLFANILAYSAADIKNGFEIRNQASISDWTLATMSGCIAYIACTADSKAATVNNCQAALLARMGLNKDSNQLSAEQVSIKGFIVGLMDTLETAVDPEAALAGDAYDVTGEVQA